ncbi:MAG: DUF4159 domain-containing protein [Planctomycetota bacterium]|jgi:hypothetical protein
MNAFTGRPVSLSAIAVLVLIGSIPCPPADAEEGWDTPGADWGKVDDWFVKDPEKPKTTGRKPPKQISSAETMVPMPASASIFMSQNERKKPPPPEYLMGKVHWGGMKDIPGMGELQDWNLAGGDVRKLSEMAKEQNLAYLNAHTKLEDFSFNPKRMPALFVSGVRTLRFKPHHVKALREYVLNGGTVICDSVYGSPWFYRSARHLFNEMFPESPFRVIPADHPIFHVAGNINAAVYAYGEKPETGDKPFLEGIYVGSRIGVLLSRYGLGCGLEGQMRSLDMLVKRNLKPKAYGPGSARQLGRNIVAYVVGYGQVGEIEGRPELFGIADQKDPTCEFVFAEVQHGGGWNVHPNAAQALLKKLERHSPIRVNYRRASVDPRKDDLSRFPCLFFSGQADFILDSVAVENLRAFLLEEGGTLVINNGLGLASFHQAVRRELGRILPGSGFKMSRIDMSHGLFNIVHDVRKVEYTRALLEDKADELNDRPWFEGITINGELRVIYSPYDFIAGWNETAYPQMRGYEADSAWKLGVNLITYVMTH